MVQHEQLRRFIADAVVVPETPELALFDGEERDALILKLSEKAVKEFLEDYACARPPLPGESIAVGLGASKTAALLFDRVWHCSILEDPPPHDIFCNGGTEVELILQAMFFFGRKEERRPRIKAALLPTVGGRGGGTRAFTRAISEALSKNFAVTATPVYESMEAFNQQYQPGRADVVIAALDRLAVVREDRLTWPQVEEFRADPEAKRRVRRLFHWLDSELTGKDSAFIADEIAERIEAYERALKKFGVETAIGSIRTVLQPEYLKGLGAASAALALAGGPSWAVLGAMAIVVGEVAVSVLTRAVDLSELRHQHAEIALVTELKKLE